MSTSDVDLLLTHGYFLAEDPLEQQIMRPYPPLGLLYLSAYLKQQGLAVDVLDSTFLERADFDHHIERQRPPIVGFYCNLMTRKTLLPMMRAARQAGAIVIAGGPEPASYAEEYLQHGADIIVAGEGEATLAELVPHLLERRLVKKQRQHEGSWRDGLEAIDGLIFRRGEKGQDHEIVRTAARTQLPDLNQLPFPDREAIDLERYVDVWRQHHGRGSVSLITARGCPYKCSWCSHGVYGYSHRRRSPENVADELEWIAERYQPDMVWYADDVFTINKKWLREFVEVMDRRQLHLPFETISREDRLDEETIELLAKLGCYRLWIGSESGSQPVLDAMQRRTDAARVRDMVRLLQAHGIEAGMFIMLGYEQEQIEDLEATVAHLKAAPPDQFLTTVAYPIKGTPYYQQVEDKISPLAPWATGSDRDLTVLGRHSRRFYRFATRWMVNEVAWHRQRGAQRLHPRSIKSLVNAKVGRAGMWWTRREREMGQA